MSKNFDISIVEDSGYFSIFKKKDPSEKNFDFSGIASLRQLLTDEKARILHTIKYEKPNSIYQLAKLLKRNFKSVNDDLKVLERFGLVSFVEEKTKKRVRHRPEIAADSINISLKI
jgi:predicted transcriptional regulator